MKTTIDFHHDTQDQRIGFCVSLFPFRGKPTKIEISEYRSLNRPWRKVALTAPELVWATPEVADRLALGLMIALKLVPVLNKDPEKITKKHIKQVIWDAEFQFTQANPFEGE